MNLSFTSKFRDYLDLFNTPIGLAQAKYAMIASYSKKKYEKLAVVIISRCCLRETAKNCTKIYNARG